MINIISPSELKQRIDNISLQILDVREPSEHAICRIDGSLHIPMNEITTRIDELNKTKETVVVCHHGMRSMQIALLLENHGFENVSNLQGGIDAWAIEIDPAMARY